MKAAYVATGLYLQKNMIVLKHLSALEPIVRRHTEAMQYMKALPDLARNVLSEEDLQTYALEMQRFHTDSTLPVALLDTRFDTPWELVFQTGKFPALSKMMAALLSCCHGMGDVITKKGMFGNHYHSECEILAESIREICCAVLQEVRPSP